MVSVGVSEPISATVVGSQIKKIPSSILDLSNKFVYFSLENRKI